VGSNPTGGMDVCRECCVLSGRGPCDELITRLEESYRLWCVIVCDPENLMNEEALAHKGGGGLSRRTQTNILIISFPNQAYTNTFHFSLFFISMFVLSFFSLPSFLPCVITYSFFLFRRPFLLSACFYSPLFTLLSFLEKNISAYGIFRCVSMCLCAPPTLANPLEIRIN
jgi:hypothetical protein